MAYSVGTWRGYGAERPRLAVFCSETGVAYFPKRYGRKAAERLAVRMNKESSK